MDDFCATLFEEAKRFYEKAAEVNATGKAEREGKAAYLHASLYLASCALEGYVNSIASDFLTRTDLSIHERGFLSEREVRLEDGTFVTKDALKMARLEERIAFLCARYGRQSLPKTEAWWTAFQRGVDLRNSLTHPKTNVVIDAGDVERYLLAILELIEFLFRKIYKKQFPLKARGIQSKLTF